MSDRIPLDHLTSDQYDELCDRLEALQQIARGYCPACGRGDAAPTVEHWEQQKQRADQAEARLRHLQASSEAAGILLTRTADERDRLQAALDDRPAGGTPPVHVGGRVNAEDCPACTAAVVPPPYPWICPGPS